MGIHLLECAAELVTVDGSNDAHDRAITELVARYFGLSRATLPSIEELLRSLAAQHS